MATVIPRKKSEFSSFCTVHTSIWDTHAAALGLSVAQVSGWKTAVGDFQDALVQAGAAKSSALAATMLADNAFNTAYDSTAGLVRTIKNYAQSTSNPDVYAIAQIPAPASPTSVPPPGQPTDTRASLNADGSLTLHWKCTNPTGGANAVFYNVHRRIGAAPLFTLVGGSGNRTYTDITIPAGTPSIVYQVRAQRGGEYGPPSVPFQVSFGVAGGGGGVGGGQAYIINAASEEGDEDEIKMAA